jgi:GT2 family glycosyltransferase
MSGVSIVIPTQSRFDLLDACLASVMNARREADETSELIVVNDGNRTGPAAIVTAHDPRARVIELPHPTGFSNAVSTGIEASGSRWILLLNDDTTVEPSSIGELLRVARARERVGSLTPQLRFARDPDMINSAGLVIDDLGVAQDRLLGAPVTASEPDVTEVFGSSAAAVLYSRQMLQEIGGFDRSFHAYLEDADVAWRARMRGWSALYVPSAIVNHHHSATLEHYSARKYYLGGRNRVRLLAKNADGALLRRRGLSMVAYDLAYVLFVAITQRQLAPLRGRVAGLRQWRTCRRKGAPGRRPLELPKANGLRGALRRNRVWSRSTSARNPLPAGRRRI